MTTYDSTVGARQNIATGSDAVNADIDATRDQLAGSRVKQALNRTRATAGQTVRNRPVLTSATGLALAAVTAAGVIGGRKLVEARRPRSRWERLLDRVR